MLDDELVARQIFVWNCTIHEQYWIWRPGSVVRRIGSRGDLNKTIAALLVTEQ